MASIFISYRRVGALVHARGIFERLRSEFGAGGVFIDLDGLEYGVDFVEVLEQQLNGCRVMLAIIDPEWATATDRHGRSRINQPHDFVRLEIETALRRGIRTVPILIEGAIMPDPEELPETLRSLARRNAMFLDFSRFDSEISRLITVLRPLIDRSPDAHSPSAEPGSAGSPLRTPERPTEFPRHADPSPHVDVRPADNLKGTGNPRGEVTVGAVESDQRPNTSATPTEAGGAKRGFKRSVVVGVVATIAIAFVLYLISEISLLAGYRGPAPESVLTFDPVKMFSASPVYWTYCLLEAAFQGFAAVLIAFKVASRICAQTSLKYIAYGAVAAYVLLTVLSFDKPVAGAAAALDVASLAIYVGATYFACDRSLASPNRVAKSANKWGLLIGGASALAGLPFAVGGMLS